MCKDCEEISRVVSVYTSCREPLKGSLQFTLDICKDCEEISRVVSVYTSCRNPLKKCLQFTLDMYKYCVRDQYSGKCIY